MKSHSLSSKFECIVSQAKPGAAIGICKARNGFGLLTKLSVSCSAALEKSSSQLFYPLYYWQNCNATWSLSVLLIDPVMWPSLVIQDYSNSIFPFFFPFFLFFFMGRRRHLHGNFTSSFCLQISFRMIVCSRTSIEMFKCLWVNVRLGLDWKNCYCSLDMGFSFQMDPKWDGSTKEPYAFLLSKLWDLA